VIDRARGGDSDRPPQPPGHQPPGHQPPESGSDEPLVWLNGEIMPRSEARISAFDAGFQHAVGVFETMLAIGSHVCWIDRHLERLADSARLLGLTESLRTAALREAVEGVVRRNGLPSSRVRLTVTGGDLNLLQSASRAAVSPQSSGTPGGDAGVAAGEGRARRQTYDPTILIAVQPRTPYPESLFRDGAMVTVADARANPLEQDAGHKTLAYWSRIRALQIAGRAGASESLWFSVTNHLAGGCVSNAFIVRDGRLLTPYARGEEESGALPAPVLPGIVRRFVIETAESAGPPVARRMLTIDECLQAEEMFLTNSSWGILPVVRLERATIGAGTPGPITKRLRHAWVAATDGRDAAGE